jgi:hypothetical protein
VTESRSAAPLLVGVGLALIIFVAAAGTPADADLWGHLRFGADIVHSRSIVQVDRYSFTSDRSWINHEWLAEVALFAAYRVGGSLGLVALKLGVIALVLTIVWFHLRRAGASLKSAIVWTAVAFIGIYWRTRYVRPQLFSVLLFACLLVVLTRAENRLGRLWLVPPLMAVWVSLHGGWIVGLGALGVWTTMRTIDSRLPVGRRVVIAGVAVAAVAATLASPFGARMWAFLAETVRFSRGDIEEWGSILTYPLALGIPWAVVLCAAGFAAWRGRVRQLDALAIAGGLALASFRVSRLDAFFAIAVVLLLAPPFVRVTSVARAEALPQAVPRGVVIVTLAAVIAMLVPTMRIVGPLASCLTIAGGWVPDEEAGRFIAANHLAGRMMTWFDWGEYAIWQFGPALKVSMDGRRETVYTEATIQAHRRFYAADDTAVPYLRRLDPDFIWLPARLPISKKIQAEGWVPVFTGPQSLVFARAGAGPFLPATKTSTKRCFPGP